MSSRIYELILNEFLEKIQNGTLEVGARLPTERDMCRQYGVSRGSLREALRVLEQDGYIQSIQGGGRVLLRVEHNGHVAQNLTRRLSKISLEAYFELREALDVAITIKACVRATAEDIQNIKVAIGESNRSFSRPEEGAHADYQVNSAIAQAAHNSLMEEIYYMTYEFIPFVRIRALRRAADRKASLEEHNRILEAIEARDPVMAELAVRIHNRNIQQRLAAADKHKMLSDEWQD